MANSTPSRPGLKQGGADNTELFLDIRGGEVITAFETTTIMRDLHMTQTLSKGKRFKFPAYWQAGTEYHVPGTEITGGVIPGTEIIIDPDDKLISPLFLADVDEFLNDLDVRSPYSDALGQAIARTYDANAIRTAILSARGAALFTGDTGGSTIVSATARTVATALFDAISGAKEVMDGKDVPVDSQPLYAVLKPAQFYLLARSDRNLNRDFNGGAASIQKHTLTTIDDIMVKKSNLASFAVNDSANANIPVPYRGNFTNTAAVVFTPYALASAIVQDVGFQVVDQPEKQGTLMIARLMVGTRRLRTKCAVEIAVA